jgi:hypothetical protein
MTVLEAIKSTVAKHLQDHLDANTFERILTDRGLSAAADYGDSSEEFELAKADVYITLITVPNISEGGYRISITEKKELRKLANDIYRKYNEPVVGQIKVPRGRASKSW